MQTITRTCNVCEAMCGMNVSVDAGRITDIRPNPQDVFSRGHICPKGPAMREVLEDPDRLRTPMQRSEDGTFHPISWDDAIQLAATQLKRIQSRYGRDALGVYIGNPTVHNHGAIIYLQGFLKALRTRNRFDANSQDANPKLLSCMQMFGDQLSIPVPDVDRTDYMLMLGANPAASNGSLMTMGDVRGRLKQLTARGGKLVLVDPRRTETAKWATDHHFIRPGADAAFLLALIHTMDTDGLLDRHYGARERGIDTVLEVARRFSPERVSPAVGIDALTIRKIALDFASAEKAVCYGRVGTCLNTFSVTTSWLIDVLNVITGNFDRPGGAMFTSPAVDVAMLGRTLVGNRYARWRSRIRGLPELGGQLPAAVIAEEMESEGLGQIRGFITIAGNPVLSTPNGPRLDAALSKLDFMLSIDIYINETSRHADLILPPSHSLEHSHYDLVLSSFAVRNIAKYSVPVVEPSADSKEDWEILYELGTAMGGLDFGPALLNKAVSWLDRRGVRLSPDRILDVLLRTGPYGDHYLPKLLQKNPHGLSLSKLREQPHGVDLGPLRPCRNDRVRHADGKVDLAPSLIVDDIPRLERWLDEAGSELVLIGRRHLRTNNSWMHNVPSLVKGPDRSSLLMHPDDLAAHALADGEKVRVTSRVGEVQAHVKRTDDIMPGVVSLPHGYGHASAKDTLSVAGPLPGPNVNALTDETLVEPLSGTAVLNGVPVQVHRLA